MPRIKPTTTFTKMTKPTTSFEVNRFRLAYLLLEDTGKFLLEDNTWVILLEQSINPNLSSTRYDTYILDLEWDFILDLEWNKITWVSWALVNNLTSNWL